MDGRGGFKLFIDLTLLLVSSCRLQRKPHIVFLLADDLGWNDVGFHNPNILTPNINKLADEGMILDQVYAQPLCSPTRSAIMTGMYPFKTGLQHLVIENKAAVCAPEHHTFLSEELKRLNYSTHIVGKWNLGFCKSSCTPTHRGFDSFFGYLGSDEGHFDHCKDGFLDYWNNSKPAVGYDNIYSSKTFTERAVEIVKNHNTATSLFLYLAFQNVHYPVETTYEYVSRYPHVVNRGRQLLSGMVSAIDDSVGKIVEALTQKGILDDTLIIFLSDNGGSLENYGNNSPLRGGKATVWEGGTRVVGAMRGSGLKTTGITYTGLIHAVDWKATLVAVAGGSLETGTDGINHWDAISNNAKTKRTEFVYNLDDVDEGKSNGHAAIRYGDYKLIHGYPGMLDGWYEPMNDTEDMEFTYLSLDEPDKTYWLFNLKHDPHERNNLIHERQDLADKLKQKLKDYHKQMVPANYPEKTDAADPGLFGGMWSPGWC